LGWRYGGLLADGICTTLEADPISLAFGEFTIGTGINDSRQIVGVYNDHITGGKGFLAAPSVVPLPAALPLFASGLAGLGWLARRKKLKRSVKGQSQE